MEEEFSAEDAEALSERDAGRAGGAGVIGELARRLGFAGREPHGAGVEEEAAHRPGDDEAEAPEAIWPVAQACRRVGHRAHQEEEELAALPEAAAQIDRVAVEVEEAPDAAGLGLRMNAEMAIHRPQMRDAAASDEIAGALLGDAQRIVGVLSPDDEIGAGRAEALQRRARDEHGVQHAGADLDEARSEEMLPFGKAVDAGAVVELRHVVRTAVGADRGAGQEADRKNVV